MHKPLHGKSSELVVEKRRDFRLIDAEPAGGLHLRDAALTENLADRPREPGLGLPLFGIHEAKVRENIARAFCDAIFRISSPACHIGPHNFAALTSSAAISTPHPGPQSGYRDVTFSETHAEHTPRS